MEGPPYSCLEFVAHDISVGVLARHSAVTGIKISVGRPYVPIPGPIHSQGNTFSLHAGQAEAVAVTWLPACVSAYCQLFGRMQPTKR